MSVRLQWLAFVVVTWSLTPRAVGSQEPSTVTRWQQWADTLPRDARASASVATFRTNAARVDTAFASAYAQQARAVVLATVTARLRRIAKEGCTASTDVTYPEPSSWKLPVLRPADERFIAHVVQTVTVDCIRTTVSPLAALDRFTDPAFRKTVESSIKRLWRDGRELCVETAGVPVLLSPTQSCSRISRLSDAEVASEHSQVVRNLAANGVQPVYFKESVKVFARTPAGLAFVYVNLSRTTELSRASRWVAGRKIQESHAAQVAALRTKIGAS